MKSNDLQAIRFTCVTKQPTIEDYLRENTLLDDEYIKRDVVFSNDTLGSFKSDVVYCVHCNTPRMAVGYYPNIGWYMVHANCECLDFEHKKQKQDNQERMETESRNKLSSSIAFSDRYSKVSFARTNTDVGESFKLAFERCYRYAKHNDFAKEKGIGLWICGKSGVGKTHLAMCIYNDLKNKYKQKVVITNFIDINKTIKESYRFSSDITENDYISRLANVDFLIIDDFGTEKVVSRGEDTSIQNIIFDLITKRYENKKPTIFTSNYNIEQLEKSCGIMPKTIDRLFHMTKGANISIEGESYRRK